MLKLRPPQHTIDVEAEYISPTDRRAWDEDRLEAERKILIADALKKLPRTASKAARQKAETEAQAKHPVGVWLTGATRFSHDAPLTVPEILRTAERPNATATIGEYLRGTATRFVIRTLDARQFRAAKDSPHWRLEMVRYGLVRVDGVADEKGNPVTFEPDRDPSGAITDAWLSAVDRDDRLLLELVGGAIFHLCMRGADDDEGKP